MSASDYNATVDGAIGRTQISGGVITDTTHVSRADVTEWLDQHAADVDGLIGSVLGKTASGLDDSAKAQMRRYIEMQTGVDILRALGSGGSPRFVELQEAAAAQLLRLESAPERISGSAANVVFTSTPTTRTTNRTPSTFTGDNYDGF